jgi:DNA-binding response OmpR family regulator
VKRILYVDDDPALRRIFGRVASKAGFDVDVAADIDEARRFVATNQYVLLVSDYMLTGGLVGTELLADIAPQQPDAGLLLLSALEVDVRELEIAGRRVHMASKVWPRPRLLATLEEAASSAND